jgi:hypothetical protein
MKDHTMGCSYPEGCTCGANEWNELEAHNQALQKTVDRLTRERDRLIKRLVKEGEDRISRFG